MDEHLKAFLDQLLKSHGADLHGSWANLHLQVSEKVLNELLEALLKSQRDTNPWLKLIQSAHATGSVSLEVKVHV